MTSNIHALLNKLRDNPADNSAASENVLQQIYDHLMSAKQDSTGRVHWFCSQASDTVVASAGFLLRLYGFNGPSVDTWKTTFRNCVSNCCDCAQQLEEVKASSRATYFGAYSPEVLSRFFEKFEEWELQMVIEDLEKRFSTKDLLSVKGQALSDLPPTLLYRMVVNWTVFSDPRIQALFRQCVAPKTVSGWPTGNPPPVPGALALLIHESQDVRQWARKQCLASQLVMMASERFTNSYSSALAFIANAVHPNPKPQKVSSSQDPNVLWPAFGIILRLVPIDRLITTRVESMDLGHIITSHLHDTGSHFIDILRSFLLLLKRLGEKFWSNDEAEYPNVVFASVKDNPAFLNILQDLHQTEDRLWSLSWMPELLLTLQGHAAYGQILEKVIDFLCEELQHERFDTSRPIIMSSALQLLASVFGKYKGGKDSPHSDALLNILNIHSNTLVAVAFSKEHDKEPWKKARSSARSLVRDMLSFDIQKILGAISSCRQSLAQVKTQANPNPIPAFSFRSQLWASAYGTVQGKDLAGLSTLITVVADASYLTKFLKESFKGLERVPAAGKGTVSGDKIIDQINDALETVQTGLKDAIVNFVNYSMSTSALELLQQTGVGKAVILLLLSPTPDLSDAARNLIGLVFDVDDRADCFRAMFKNMPEATFVAIQEYLTKFSAIADQVPDASPASKSLVRCFNDVLEVLCASPDGLFLQEDFVRPKNVPSPGPQFLNFWKALNKALATIFKRTVAWTAYYKTKDLVEWMRDALILGKDVVNKWRVVETAVNGLQQKRSSDVRGRMIAPFQEMLPGLLKWLRLTDQELLYQSFQIFRTLLRVFQETNTRPLEESLAKLTKYVSDARKDGQAKSRLDGAQLMLLEQALSAFDESTSDDEIQIISHVPAPKKTDKATAPIFASSSSSSTLSAKREKKADHRDEPPAKKQQLGPSGKALQSKLAIEAKRKAAATKQIFTSADKTKLGEPARFPTFQKTTAPPEPSKSVTSGKSKKIEPRNESLGWTDDPESTEESDDEDQKVTPEVGLSALGQVPAPKSHKVRKPEKPLEKPEKHEKRQIKTLDLPIGKSAIQERLERSRRSQYDAAFRLRPDISGLHKKILSWKYDHDGTIPPGEDLKLNHVPADFKDYNQYRAIFEPLLLLECWAQIMRSKEDPPMSYACKVTSKEYVSDWVDLDLSITDNPPRDWELTAETDILLLRSPDKQRSIMAKTLHHKKDPMGPLVRARCFVPGGMDPGLLPGSIWEISKIYSLSTINREYAALMSLPYLSCLPKVLTSRVDKASSVDSSEIQRAMSTLNVNTPQATAIVGAMKTEGFVLIQGPPGTGKTSTICGLVRRFISQRPTPINVPEKQATPPKAKILICAPSNAAIDEIASRLISLPKKINVVRTGAENGMNASVKSVSLDRLVMEKIEAKTGMQGNSMDETNKELRNLRMELDSLKHLRQEKLKELTNLPDNTPQRAAVQQQAQNLGSRQREIQKKFNDLKDKSRSDNRTFDSLRRQMRKEVFEEADVVCSTLSGSGHESLLDQDFEMVIIDEAAQSIELSSLIPLKFNCIRCVMVGDPQQLPPTVISQDAARRRYDQSLFLRLFQRNPNSVHLLSIQYRMHPDISRFPSEAFYQGRIEDGPKMSELTSRPWHTQPMFGTYKFFNVTGVEEQGRFNSLKNVAECKVAKAIYRRLSREFEAIATTRRIGIVSMYRAQIEELRMQFITEFGRNIVDIVDFNTVDGFQGQEKDIIILSCVRAGPGLQSIGFLSDIRRLNVAITRAKSSLFILGNAPTLERSDDTWKQVVSDARTRSRLINVTEKFFAQPATAVANMPCVSPVKKAPAEKKSNLSAPTQLIQPPVPVPLDLVKPQELKNQSRRVASTSTPSTGIVTPAQTLKGVAPEVPPTVAGIKRPAAADEEQELPKAGPSNQARNPARPPPPKKPKGPSLFIPKKPKK